jgi:hypothetical protein
VLASLSPSLCIFLHTRLNLDLHIPLVHQGLDLLFNTCIVCLSVVSGAHTILCQSNAVGHVMVYSGCQLVRMCNVVALYKVTGKGALVIRRRTRTAFQVASGMCQAQARERGGKDAARVVDRQREVLQGDYGQGPRVYIASADRDTWLRVVWRV